MKDAIKDSAISVDMGVLVTMPIERWNSLKDVEADKERYAQHIREHNTNLSAANAEKKEIEDKLAETELKNEGLTKKVEELTAQVEVLQNSVGSKKKAPSEKAPVIDKEGKQTKRK